MREGNSTVSGQNRNMVPIPNMERNQNGIDTKTKWYQYHSPEQDWYRYRSVPVSIPVPLLHTTLIFGILTLLSPNSYSDSIGTLIND